MVGAQYPPLAALPAEARTRLFTKLPPTSEPSFLQWCRHYKVEASPSVGAAVAKARAPGSSEGLTAAMQIVQI